MNKEIRELMRKRDELRKEKKFREADEIRKQIEKLGYIVHDEPGESVVTEKGTECSTKNGKQFLALFGSGEISSVGRSVYEHVLKELGKDKVKISIITTPAGFQPNVRTVHEEIADFITQGLQNYHPEVTIIYANDTRQANDRNIVSELEGTDLMFMGPGSPTYAVHNLKHTLLMEKITGLLKHNVSLFLSSAAVLAFSRFTLPVYEIYKVGSPLQWEQGLDLFSSFIDETTIIPHCNNTEGMPKLDTSFCFMGKDRFKMLRSLLPPGETVQGIDEQTALLMDLNTRKRTVIGKGTVHVL